MKVFVTGGTGAIGPHAIRALIEAGHDVSALVRSEAKAGVVATLGARPVFASLYDAAALTAAFEGHDAVVNLATAIPSTMKYAFAPFWRENTRIRTEGTAAVVDATLSAGVPRLIQESIALAYPDRADQWIDEDVPLGTFPIVRSTPTSEATIERFTAAGGTGIVLRFGLFYGPGSAQSAEMLAMARARFGLVLGSPKTFWSPIHLEDAGRAVLAALTAPAGTYNVVDDEPVTKRAFADAISAAAGRRAWIHAPGSLTALGGANTAALTRSMRVSNQRFKQATDWTPRHRSAREGWKATAARWSPDWRGVLLRAIAAVLAVNFLTIGIWATFSPASWFADFPGFGRHWATAYPPFNEHLTADIGGFYLAFGLAALVGAATGSRPFLVAIGLITAVEALPHLLFHTFDHHHVTSGDYLATLISLSTQFVVGLVLLRYVRKPRPSAWR